MSDGTGGAALPQVVVVGAGFGGLNVVRSLRNTPCQIILLDRTKWHEKRLLRFNVREILDRRETSTLQAMAALLHRDSICPKDGLPLLRALSTGLSRAKAACFFSHDAEISMLVLRPIVRMRSLTNSCCFC